MWTFLRYTAAMYVRLECLAAEASPVMLFCSPLSSACLLHFTFLQFFFTDMACIGRQPFFLIFKKILFLKFGRFSRKVLFGHILFPTGQTWATRHEREASWIHSLMVSSSFFFAAVTVGGSRGSEKRRSSW